MERYEEGAEPIPPEVAAMRSMTNPECTRAPISLDDVPRFFESASSLIRSDAASAA